MRLIDADKLENDIVENITVKAVSRMLAITQGQPTVNAIPIEFIKEEMESSRYIWSNSSVKTELYWRGVYQGLMVLIRNWEKENEQEN